MIEPDTPADAGMLAVKVENVSFSYGKVTALKQISLDIPSGKLVGLIGPDGVGKSTLLSLISGSRAMQNEGQILVFGGDMRDKKYRDKICPKIAYMPQGLGKNLYFTLTVEENLQFFARLFGHDKDERRRRIDQLTKKTGLYPFLDRPAGKLSGGMKQKLGLCCALIHDPELLILDEPTTGVDPLARRQFWDLVDDVRRENPGMGVVVATAYMDEAQRFDWLIAMDGGIVLDTATPDELLAKTGKADLDAAFIQLLPENRRHGHKELVVPPLNTDENDIVIEAENLTKKFGSFTAVDHVSFRIQTGEIFGFLGSNGCGKTTTMRMLTGLLPSTEGTAKLFGREIDSTSMDIRRDLGYMTQLFSLYNELTVRQNLELCARLYGIAESEVAVRTRKMIERFQLTEVAEKFPDDLPLGIKQRMSLAAAVIHQPKILILDEPTSGVDPVARDLFWEMIISLSREDKVTIFITTHFMNEAERCDRISLMHAGRSLACGKPEELVAERKASTLEEAFIGYLEDADPASNKRGAKIEQVKAENSSTAKPRSTEKKHLINWQRVYSCFWRENLELLRDPIRATLALFGALILMVVIGYGINMDVENLTFAVLDNDGSQSSINYIFDIAGSRYFKECPPIKDHADLDRRMQSGEISCAVEIPPQFGKQLAQHRNPEVAFYVDGAMPTRAETINGYIKAIHSKWLEKYNRENGIDSSSGVNLEVRYRYNPDVLSLPAMVPAVIPMLLMMIPAILAALSVVREKEMGSIINLYVTPLTRTEFMLGKQIPYLLFSLFSALLLVVMAVTVFDVPIKGSVVLLISALILYCLCSTGMGLLASSVTKSQIAVIFLTMLGTIIPASQFCGMINPVSAQTGLAKFIGSIYPTSYMLLISRGVFNKALGFSELWQELLILLISYPVIFFAGVNFLKKQDS